MPVAQDSQRRGWGVEPLEAGQEDRDRKVCRDHNRPVVDRVPEPHHERRRHDQIPNGDVSGCSAEGADRLLGHEELYYAPTGAGSLLSCFLVCFYAFLL